MGIPFSGAAVFFTSLYAPERLRDKVSTVMRIIRCLSRNKTDGLFTLSGNIGLMSFPFQGTGFRGRVGADDGVFEKMRPWYCEIAGLTI
jgi:hypothetical protein